MTLHGLQDAANKVWKDANDTVFSHLLRYDEELATFISSAEDALKNKEEAIWQCIHSLLGVTNCSPLICLFLSLQILQWLPSILWNLSFHEGIPSMFAYSPELYKLQPWGAVEDEGFTLDSDTQATSLLTQKLAYLCDRGTSPASSAT